MGGPKSVGTFRGGTRCVLNDLCGGEGTFWAGQVAGGGPFRCRTGDDEGCDSGRRRTPRYYVTCLWPFCGRVCAFSKSSA